MKSPDGPLPDQVMLNQPICETKRPESSSGCPPHARQPCQTASAAQTHGRRHSGVVGLRPAISGRTGLVLTDADGRQPTRSTAPLRLYLAGLKRRQSLLAMLCWIVEWMLPRPRSPLLSSLAAFVTVRGCHARVTSIPKDRRTDPWMDELFRFLSSFKRPCRRTNRGRRHWTPPHGQGNGSPVTHAA